MDKTTTIHITIDGEVTPSIVANLFLWHGLDWRDNVAEGSFVSPANRSWSSKRFSNLAKNGGISNTVRIPFSRSISIALSSEILYPDKSLGSDRSSLWCKRKDITESRIDLIFQPVCLRTDIVRGVEQLPVVLGDLQLPLVPSLRLRLYKNEGVVLGPNCFLTCDRIRSPQPGLCSLPVTARCALCLCHCPVCSLPVTARFQCRQRCHVNFGVT